MKFKLLNQYHADYDHEKLDRMEALYKGGDYLTTHLPLFIPQKPNEHPQVYADRVACASYINYMAEIIDYYTSSLFSKPLVILPAADAGDPETMGDDIQAPEFYQQFSADADLSGNSFSCVMQKVLTDALTYGCGYVGVDFPLTEVPATLQEEEMIGADRAYLYCIDVETLINYSCDDFGSFKWAVLKKTFIPQDDPFAIRDKKITQFKVWTMQGEFAKWQLYEIETKLNRDPRDQDEVALVAEGITSFRQIPIVCLEMEKGLWIGNKIGNLCADHLRMRTALIHSESRSLYAAPYYKQGEDTFDGPGDDANRGKRSSNVFANRGFMVLGGNDEVGFMEPSGSCYEIVDSQLKELSDEIHRTVHQMANSIVASTTSLARSAASKLMDNQATEIILSEYGDLVKEFAKRVYTCVSEARNESIVWNAVGLTNYKIIDKDQLSKEALIVNNQLHIPSETFKKVYLTHLADSFVPVISPETQLIIKREIEEAVDAGEVELNSPAEEQESQAFTAGLKNPPVSQGSKASKPAIANEPTEEESAESDDNPGLVGETGHMAGYEGMHLQTGEHVDANVVINSISGDYKPQDYQWLKMVPIKGPMEVPLSAIDWSLEDKWAATQPGPNGTEKVDAFADKLSNEGWWKPIILANTLKDNEKMQVIDGRHRAQAAKKLGIPVLAYIAEVGSFDPDLPHMQMHGKQVNSVSGKVQKS